MAMAAAKANKVDGKHGVYVDLYDGMQGVCLGGMFGGRVYGRLGHMSRGRRVGYGWRGGRLKWEGARLGYRIRIELGRGRMGGSVVVKVVGGRGVWCRLGGKGIGRGSSRGFWGGMGRGGRGRGRVRYGRGFGRGLGGRIMVKGYGGGARFGGWVMGRGGGFFRGRIRGLVWGLRSRGEGDGRGRGRDSIEEDWGRGYGWGLGVRGARGVGGRGMVRCMGRGTGKGCEGRIRGLVRAGRVGGRGMHMERGGVFGRGLGGVRLGLRVG
ncbi:hypothetical protein DPMN_111987 [Dreissena polymorpha]|uniref:Uncharacterized protein n=1 Tax=Dreissena polymorpha TaxID=45954 RepID=A0A9D4KFN6_DREPO|nr:hypothetical protein DPMN_111987 [Dreissena polymorpha]